jgi:DNA-binding XRE family transcriptional regulator
MTDETRTPSEAAPVSLPEIVQQIADFEGRITQSLSAIAQKLDGLENPARVEPSLAPVAAAEAEQLPPVAEPEPEGQAAAPTPFVFWRKHRGMTQTQLAEAAGVSQPYIAQLEAGAKPGAAAAVYARLARCLGVRIDDLIEIP